MKKQVAVIGIGRFGRSVASALYNLGHDVLAIDKKEERVQDMLGKVTYPVSGDATNELTLKELGVPSYDAAIVAIGSDTVSSLMTSVLLRSLKEDMYIVARAQDELQSNALRLVGVNKTVLAEHEMGEQIAHNLFNPNVQEYMSMNSTYGISKILIPKHIQGKSLKELNIGTSRDKYNLTALGIVRSKNIILNPDVNEIIKKNDILLIAGNNELINKLTD
ncbi:MAG: potassium uptake system protein [Chloroflexi bacterium]|jgi:trk system potassium uptake protein TrkA|nr:potassium uptake system protein [Chloroflexota bacterium]|tara:strand:+ start:3671 stop:4330 length:660 start_codon:yes stop_codon:yes gene_type:complete